MHRSSSAERKTSVRSVHVGIIGLGRTGCTVLNKSIQWGFQNFYLADTRPVGNVDIANNPLLGKQDLGIPRGEAIVTQLRSQLSKLDLTLVQGPEAGSEWAREWISQCNICILCADFSDPAYMFAVNTACLSKNVPLIPGLIMGSVGQMGPVVHRGQGPCLRCVDIRINAALGRPSYSSPTTPDERVINHIADAVVEQLVQHFTDKASETARNQLHYTWADGSSTQHSVLRTARCLDCSNFAPRIPFREKLELSYDDHPQSDTYRILHVKSKLVDSITGPIRSLERYKQAPQDPAIRHWVSALVDICWAGFGLDTVYCGGNALTDDDAMAAALGESLDRMAACQPTPSDLIMAKYVELGADAVDPLLWDLFHPRTRKQAGFPFVRPSRDHYISWVWGYSLTRRRPLLIPAMRVFSPFQPRTNEDYVDFTNVSGFATGSTLEEATLAALLEVIERDTFMIAWANQLPLKRLELSQIEHHDVSQYFRAFAESGLSVRCSTIQLDLGAPMVLAMVRSSKQGEPSIVVSAASHIDILLACKKALKELAANRINVRYNMIRHQGQLPTPDPEHVIDETAHGLLFARSDMSQHLDQWWDPEERITIPNSRNRDSTGDMLAQLVSDIARQGLEVLVVDLTPPEIKELGLWTVKALVPGTYPMNFDGRWPHFGGSRMSAAPVTAGVLDKTTGFDDLNRVPHPFP